MGRKAQIIRFQIFLLKIQDVIFLLKMLVYNGIQRIWIDQVFKLPSIYKPLALPADSYLIFALFFASLLYLRHFLTS